MKVGDYVCITAGENQGKTGTVTALFWVVHDGETLDSALVRLVEHPEWQRRVPISHLQVVPDFPPDKPDDWTELPREWASALV